MFPSDENSKSLKLKTKGKKKEIPSSPMPRSRKVSKNLDDDIEKPTEDVLRIQGGSSCTRDVWDILAQAAEEIEDLYANQDMTQMANRFSDAPRTPLSGLNQSRESTCIRRLQFSSPRASCDNANSTYDSNATYDATPPCPGNQTFTARSSPRNRTYNANATYDANATCDANATYEANATYPVNATYNANATYDPCPPCPQPCPPCPQGNQTYTAGSPRNRTYDVNATYDANATYDVCPTNRTYNAGSPRNRTYSPGSSRNQTYSIGSSRDRTYSVSSPRSDTYISEGSDYECDYSSGRSMSNGTFVLSEGDDSFRPHPALTSTPQMRGGRLPRFRNFTCPSLRSGHEAAYHGTGSYGLAGHTLNTTNEGTFNSTYDVSGGCPNRTYDVSGGCPNRTYDVSGGCPNRTYNVSGRSPNRTYNVSRGGSPNATYNVSRDCPNATFNVTR